MTENPTATKVGQIEGKSSEGYASRADCEINQMRNGRPCDETMTKKAQKWAAENGY